MTFNFNKRAELFVGMHNKALSIAAVGVKIQIVCPLELIVPQLEPAFTIQRALASTHRMTN